MAFDASAIILGFAGPIGSGCTFISKMIVELSNNKYKYFNLSDIIRECIKKRLNRLPSIEELQNEGDLLRKKYGISALPSKLMTRLNQQDEEYSHIIIDGIKHIGEIVFLRQFPNFFLFSVSAHKDIRLARLVGKQLIDVDSFDKADRRDESYFNVINQQIEECKHASDIVISNEDDVSGNQAQDFGISIYENYVKLIENNLTGKRYPEVFLRKAGISQTLIDQIPTVVGQLSKYYSCFISYSHADKSFAQKLYETLNNRGIRCWLDEHQILPGDEIYQAVDSGINRWDKVLLCCSKSSLTSWWVDNEISTAFSKEQHLMKKQGRKILVLIPLNLDGFLFDNECENTKAHQIKERLAADFSGWENDESKFEEQLNKVVKSLMVNDLGREYPPETKL